MTKEDEMRLDMLREKKHETKHRWELARNRTKERADDLKLEHKRIIAVTDFNEPVLFSTGERVKISNADGRNAYADDQLLKDKNDLKDKERLVAHLQGVYEKALDEYIDFREILRYRSAELNAGEY